jgi:hypothetical protein
LEKKAAAEGAGKKAAAAGEDKAEEGHRRGRRKHCIRTAA